MVIVEFKLVLLSIFPYNANCSKNGRSYDDAEFVFECDL